MKKLDCKTVNKGSGRPKMFRSTAAALVLLEFDQTLSLRICLARISGSEQLEISKNITCSTEKPWYNNA